MLDDRERESAREWYKDGVMPDTITLILILARLHSGGPNVMREYYFEVSRAVKQAIYPPTPLTMGERDT
jgi:hypothetical protein